MSLLTLPALWLGRDALTVFQLMTEAVERLVPVELSYVDVQVTPDEAPLKLLRVLGHPARPGELAEWAQTLQRFERMPIGMAPVQLDSPLGPLRVLRLSMGYSAAGGCVWFAARSQSVPGFPELTDAALLRAGASLAATGLQSVRIEHERRRASRAKDEFLAMLGHELRNPLAPIFTALELIRRSEGADSGPLSGAHGIIERQARHLSRLVDDLLDISRISQGKMELAQEPVSLWSILRDAREAVEPLVQLRRHQLTIDLPEPSPVVRGDATRLSQIFVNLLTNAAKYTPANGRISLAARVEGERVEIRVIDNGDGISAELMPRLFRIFEQGDTAIDRSRGGLGVGLALVQNFVQLHGGTVSASSEGAGRGASFTVSLPILPGLAAGLPAAGALAPLPLHKESLMPMRVMLVDDNVDALDTMAEVLRISDFEVATADTPEEALKLAPLFKPDVAILDVGLPGMDGYQLAAALRAATPPGQRLRLITLSGYGRSVDHQRSAAAGLERHLVKPVDLDEMIAILNASPSA